MTCGYLLIDCNLFEALNDDSGEICKPSSSCKDDIVSGFEGITELGNNLLDSPVYSDFFKVT